MLDDGNRIKAKAINQLPSLAETNDIDNSSTASPLALKSPPRSGRGWERTPLGSLLTLGHLSIGLGHDKVAVAPDTTTVYQEKEDGKGLTLCQDEDWGEDTDEEKLVAQHSPLRNKPVPPLSPFLAVLEANANTAGNGDGSGNGMSQAPTKDDGGGGAAGSCSRDGLHSRNTSTSTSRKGSVEQPVPDIIGSSSSIIEASSPSEPTSNAPNTLALCRLDDAVFTRPRVLGLGFGVSSGMMEANDDDDDKMDSVNSSLKHRDSLLLPRTDTSVVPTPSGEAVARPQRNNCPIAVYYPPSWGGTTENTKVMDNGDDGKGVPESDILGGDWLTIETTTTTSTTNDPLPPQLPVPSVEQSVNQQIDVPSSCGTTDATIATISKGSLTAVDGRRKKSVVAALSRHHRIITPTPIIAELPEGHIVEGDFFRPIADNATSLKSTPSQGS